MTEKPPGSTAESSAGALNPSIAVSTAAQDWTGPDDPENPQNWCPAKKTYHALAVGILCFSVTAGTSMISPAIPEIQEHFQVSRTAAILSLSLFVIGMAVGPMIAGPLSEYQGRRSVYLVLPPIYLLLVMGAGLTNSYGGLLVLRFLAGAAGAPPLAVGAGTIADLYAPAEQVIPLSLYISTPFLGSGFGPVIGGFATQYKSYRWTQWCTIFVGIASYTFALMMKETYKKTILERRAKRLGLAPPVTSKRLSTGAYVTRLLRMTILVPVQMLILEPIVFLLTLYNAFTFSVLFAFFAAYPYVFERVYGFSTWESGMPFLAIALGIIFAGFTGVFVDIWIYRPKHIKAKAEGKVGLDAEERLYSAMMGSLGVPIGLFWFAWTSRSSVHWIVPILSGVPFAWGSVAVFLSAALYLTDTYGPLLGASAFAANGLGRYFMSAAFPLFTLQMYEHMGIAWASSLLGFLSLILVPIPWVFFKYGPFLRSRSRFRKSKL